jgi:hypothetical protein
MLDNSTTSNTHAAKAMEDRPVEATHSGHVGVSVERVHVTTSKSVKESLPVFSGELVDLISGALRNLDFLLLRSAITTEPANATDEDSHLVDKDNFVLLIARLGLEDDEGTLSLVVDALDATSVGKSSRGRNLLLDLKVLLTVKEHHGVELEAWNSADNLCNGTLDSVNVKKIKKEISRRSFYHQKVLVLR